MSEQLVLTVLGLVAAFSSILFVWFTVLRMIDAPPCEPLISHASSSMRAYRVMRFARAPLYVVDLGGRQFSVDLAESQHAVSRASHRAGPYQAGYCPHDSGFTQLWELLAGDHAIITVEGRRAESRRQARVSGASAALLGATAAFL